MTDSQLAIYLPYELQCVTHTGKIETITGMNITSHGVLVKLKGIQDQNVFKIKPILRPIADLEKETRIGDKVTRYIDELLRKDKYSTFRVVRYVQVSHNEVVFKYEYSYPDEEFVYKDNFFTTGKGSSASFKYSEIQKLASWHFDVFGLIDKGLAIDINDLKNQ